MEAFASVVLIGFIMAILAAPDRWGEGGLINRRPFRVR